MVYLHQSPNFSPNGGVEAVERDLCAFAWEGAQYVVDRLEREAHRQCVILHLDVVELCDGLDFSGVFVNQFVDAVSEELRVAHDR